MQVKQTLFYWHLNCHCIHIGPLITEKVTMICSVNTKWRWRVTNNLPVWNKSPGRNVKHFSSGAEGKRKAVLINNKIILNNKINVSAFSFFFFLSQFVWPERLYVLHVIWSEKLKSRFSNRYTLILTYCSRYVATPGGAVSYQIPVLSVNTGLLSFSSSLLH